MIVSNSKSILQLQFKAAILLTLLVLICVVFSGQAFAWQAYAQWESGFESGLSPFLEYEPTKRLWVDVMPDSNGLRVTGLYPNSPLLRMRSQPNASEVASIEIGDVIQAIDGTATTRLEELSDGVSNSSDWCQLTILDRNSGQSMVWYSQPMTTLVPKPHHSRVAAFAPAAPKSSKLYVLIVALNGDPRIGVSIETSRSHLLSFLKGEISSSRYEINEIVGNDCTPSKIIEAIQSLPIGFADSLLVYYLGHGAYDAGIAMTDPYGGHFLDLPGKDLLRRTLWDHMESVPARLRVLVTDACNVKSAIDPDGKYVREVRNTVGAGFGATNAEWLFLGHSGHCDIAAASKDQFAWYSPDIGGWFTHSFVRTSKSSDEWNLLGQRVVADTQQLYLRKRDETIRMPGTTQATTIDQLESQAELTPHLFISRLKRDSNDPIDPTVARPKGMTEITVKRVP